MSPDQGEPVDSDDPCGEQGANAPAVEPSNDAELYFAYPTTERARLVARSARQEVGEITGDRTQTTVTRDGSRVLVQVSAEDLVALRAGLNTWTSLVEVAERVAGTADP